MKVNKLISVLVLAAVIPFFYSCIQTPEDTAQDNNTELEESEKKEETDTHKEPSETETPVTPEKPTETEEPVEK